MSKYNKKLDGYVFEIEDWQPSQCDACSREVKSTVNVAICKNPKTSESSIAKTSFPVNGPQNKT